jgi:aspartate aminotransferase
MIPADLRDSLAALERFEAIRAKVVALGPQLCDLAYANPYRGAREGARSAIREALDDERLLGFQYSPFGGHTVVRRRVADALRGTHGLDFTFRDVILTSGAMAALHIALRMAARADGEVIVPVPCWIDYPLYVRAIGLSPVLLPMREPSFDLDVDTITDAITERTCAILFSHPANPTGRAYQKDGLQALAGALEDAGERLGSPIVVISDESHRDFTDDTEFVSPSTFIDRTVIVYSFGKYHFLQGQRIGYAAVSPRYPDREQVTQELVRWTRILGLATPTALMQKTVPRLLDLHHDLDWVTAWRARYVAELTTFGYLVVTPDATLFIYVQTPQGCDDFGFIEQLASASVLALPAPVFHHRGYFRLSLTGSEDMLERALPILQEAAGGA